MQQITVFIESRRSAQHVSGNLLPIFRSVRLQITACVVVSCCSGGLAVSRAATWHYVPHCRSIHFSSIQFILQSTDPLQGHKEHMDMEIVKLYNLYIYRVILLILKREKTVSHRINILL
jgi:hypothetical protein